MSFLRDAEGSFTICSSFQVSSVDVLNGCFYVKISLSVAADLSNSICKYQGYSQESWNHRIIKVVKEF